MDLLKLQHESIYRAYGPLSASQHHRQFYGNAKHPDWRFFVRHAAVDLVPTIQRDLSDGFGYSRVTCAVRRSHSLDVFTEQRKTA